MEHPIVMTPHTESAAQHWVVCDRCGARWAGPFRDRDSVEQLAEDMNWSHALKVPKQVRRKKCCTLPVVVPVPAARPALGVGPAGPPRALSVAARAGWIAWTILLSTAGTVRALVRIASWPARSPVTFVTLAAGAVAGYSYLSAAGLDPGGAASTVATVLPYLAGALVVVLALGLAYGTARGRTIRNEPDAPVLAGTVLEPVKESSDTPLTTAPGSGNVSPVSKTPADGSPQG